MTYTESEWKWHVIDILVYWIKIRKFGNVSEPTIFKRKNEKMRAVSTKREP